MTTKRDILTIFALICVALMSVQTLHANGAFLDNQIAASLNTSMYDIESIPDCSEYVSDNKYYVDLYIKASNASSEFNLSNAYVRLKYNNIMAIGNPRPDPTLGLVGLQTDVKQHQTFFNGPSLNLISDGIISYNLNSNPNDPGFYLEHTTWTYLGRVIFDVLDPQAAVTTTINDTDPQNFPPTFILERNAGVLAGVAAGDFTSGICVPPCVRIPLENEDFEVPSSTFQESGTNAGMRVNSGFCPGGFYCMGIRGNSSTAFFSFQSPLSSFDEITFDFDFQSNGNFRGSWFMEYSEDGGNTYNVIRTWVEGIDFVSEVVFNTSVTIPVTAQLGSVSIVRFRANGQNNGDKIFVDNVVIEGCMKTGSGNRLVTEQDIFETNSIKSKEQFEIQSFSVYPNPAQSNLTVTADISNTSFAELVVTDFTGKVLMKKALDENSELSKTQIDVSRWPGGIYFATILSDQKPKTEKIIIAKD